ncbi:hypothetical protein ACCI51_14630 [Microbulbifer echini]|uniref:Uncharacterized protein n=1 Tax=Microbulbifer echini TaxID=1529067 RepID=A0ABV4NS67_9GAMM
MKKIRYLPLNARAIALSHRQQENEEDKGMPLFGWGYTAPVLAGTESINSAN